MTDTERSELVDKITRRLGEPTLSVTVEFKNSDVPDFLKHLDKFEDETTNREMQFWPRIL